MILITGCTGYIGSRLCRHLLKNGYKVRGLIRPSERIKAKPLMDAGLDPYFGDLTDSVSLYSIAEDIDLVYHLAGIHSTYQHTHSLYVQGTINLLQAFSGKSGIPVVLASNSAVYGDTCEAHLENTALVVKNPFGRITFEMEQAVMKLCRHYTIFRIGEVYGEGAGNPFAKSTSLIGDGMNDTSKIHIHDVINLLARCIGNLPQGIFNLCDDLPIRQIEFYRYVEALNHKSSLFLKEDIELDERIMLSIHGLRTLNIAMDNRLIKQTMGYRFIYPTYKIGLKDLYRNQG